MSSDEIRLELNKLSIIQAEHDGHIRHNAIKETHWHIQKWFWAASWVGTIALGAFALYFK